MVVCGPWNRCGNYLVFPQKRIHYDARGNITRIEALPPTVVPIYECESSDTPPPSDGEPPEDSTPSDWSGLDSSGGGGAGWSDWDIYNPVLIVSGSLTPSDAAGEYIRALGTWNGRGVWYKTGPTGTWYIWWHSVAGAPGGGYWQISQIGGDPEVCWYKTYSLDTPLGDYFPNAKLGVDGIAHVEEGGLP